MQIGGRAELSIASFRDHWKNIREAQRKSKHRHIIWHGWDRDFEWEATVPELRAELMRRGLPQDGLKQNLINRLTENNEWLSSLEGRRFKYKRNIIALEAEKRTTAAGIIPFDQFLDFPPEVRHLIWQFTLPGPRALTVSDHLAGGDTLYFGYHWLGDDTFIKTNGDDVWNRIANPIGVFIAVGDELVLLPNGFRTRQTLLGSVIADLKSVKHLALRYDMWDDPHRDMGRRKDAGPTWHQHLKQFLGLKQVMFVQESKDDSYHLAAWTLGHITFQDSRKPHRSRAHLLRKSFLEKDISEKEKRLGIPEVLIVDQTRVPNIPGDDWDQDDHVESHYIPEEFQVPYKPPPRPRAPRRSARVRKITKSRARQAHQQSKPATPAQQPGKVPKKSK
ncbi:uncharacterized protein PAC_08238 [Phialocephala subalpina]|uniref:SAP domain-containing protein n=1 Tax=Phialocephala subalpina TaxID=576137 RepID=A0A1L7X002_9HELO|nr:uncharacterized protein PAC_08238 [Phialocephala subalpina]